MKGLVIVPTPLGNLGDMTYRAVEVLKNVDLILAEDTRVSRKLLQHFGIETALLSYHQHNEHKVTENLTDRMLAGEHFALVSDAGTPGISDPGFMIVRSCVEKGVPVECLPGPSAFVPALVASGLPCDKFVFEGFLPHKKGRQKRLKALAEEERTIVFYESPHRLIKSLNQMKEFFGADRPACVAREISKLHEEYHRGSLQSLAEFFETTPPKGEIVIIVGGKG